MNWLPSYISRVYAHDLQTKSLKDLQSQIVDNMDSLLREINTHEEQMPPHYTGSVQRVQCSASPTFYAFYGHHPCKCIIDTGETSSLISSAFLKSAGIAVKPTRHAARQVDRTTIPIQGEIHILVGVPFCKENDATVHLKHDFICIQGVKIPYGTKSTKPRIYRAESYLLRNESSQVLFPGEYLEIKCKSLIEYDGEVAIEPRADSPLNGSWPSPTVSRVIHNTVRIPNTTDEPIKLLKSQHIAQVCKVTTINSSDRVPVVSSLNPKITPMVKNHLFSSLITVDPDNQLSSDERKTFDALHKNYDTVFDPTFGIYNDFSGAVRAQLNFGTEKPPPLKTKVPLYNTQNLQLLQQEADKLEELGVLARPEDLGITVQHASPSFLVKKPDGGNRFVTAFNSLSPYVRLPPTVSSDCNSVLKKLSRWKYIIKSDLTHAYFQIPLAKSAMPYLATSTPYKGFRVYTRPGMGMPGAAEYLQELLSRVLGNELQAGFLLLNADDMYIGGNTLDELLNN